MENITILLFETLKYLLGFSIASCIWKKREFITVILSTFRRDIWLLYVLYGKILLSWIGRKRRNETLFRSIDKIVKEDGGEQVCFYYGDEKWSYKQVQEMSFRVANYFQGIGLKKGDAVGLAMTTRPEHAAIWLGLGRIGVVSVLINTNLRNEALEKCVSVVECKAFIIGSELRQAFGEIWNDGNGKQLLPSDIYELDRFMKDPKWVPETVKTQIGSLRTIDFAQCLLKTSKGATVVSPDQEPTFLDPIMYIFTSGTTGVPKAVRCSHGRLFFLASTASVINFSSKDVTYNAAPMYHTGGLLAVVWAFCFRAPAVLVVKFSATNFWKDIHRYKVTVSLYVGEFCRFIHNQPENPELEKGHTLRAMFGGGGLRPEVWTAFQKRFNVKQFVDLYGSTEGNCTLINLEAKIGACGYIPVWLQPIHPIQLVKTDPVTGEVLRDHKTGFAVRCKDGEPGELIGKIVDSVPMARFDGYTDPVATEQRILRNAFAPGDKYFRTGDCFTRDKYGYYYFQDRIGDTFRWNSENVATTLVEAVISRITGLRNNTVYGVKVPGTEGSACMAAILDSSDGELELEDLANGMKTSLPKYAMPMFIRVISIHKGLDMTGTYKFQKFRLREDGFNILNIKDPVYIYSSVTESYSKMDLEKLSEVMKGNYRF